MSKQEELKLEKEVISFIKKAIVINEEQRLNFRNIIVRNANFLLKNTEMKTEDKEKLIELEKFILNNEISNNNKIPKARL